MSNELLSIFERTQPFSLIIFLILSVSAFLEKGIAPISFSSHTSICRLSSLCYHRLFPLNSAGKRLFFQMNALDCDATLVEVLVKLRIQVLFELWAGV